MEQIQKSPILFADDDENDTYFFGLAVEEAAVPNPLIPFTDGQGVIDYLQQPGGPLPALLVLDLKMPRVSGFDVLTWCRTRPELRGVPIVVLSASQQEADIRKALALGASDYHVKPSSHAGLVELVADLRKRWLERQLAVTYAT